MSEEQKDYESITTEDKGREDNIKLWRSVEKTPTSQTKPAKIGMMNITSVKPHYQRMKATEVFGPFGKGWGIVSGSETFTQCQIGETHLLKYSAELFYTIDGERYSFPICATEKEAYITNGGKGYLKIDESADKKVATNALTKGLSFLGFSADVFHGLYDDAGYIAKLREEEGSELQNKAIDEKHEYKKWRGQVQGQIMICKTAEDLEKLYSSAIKKASANNDSEIIVTLKELTTKRNLELKDKK